MQSTSKRSPPRSQLPHICLDACTRRQGSSGWWSPWGSPPWPPCASPHTPLCGGAGCSWRSPCSPPCPRRSVREGWIASTFNWIKLQHLPDWLILVVDWSKFSLVSSCEDLIEYLLIHPHWCVSWPVCRAVRPLSTFPASNMLMPNCSWSWPHWGHPGQAWTRKSPVHADNT